MCNARCRLASLWLSQVARVTADNCLRIFVVLTISAGGAGQMDWIWHLATALLLLPAVVLAPFNGAISNSLPKRGVLIGSAAYILVVVTVFACLDEAWLVCWALTALGAAVYSPTRYALLPAAADDTHIPLTRVNGWIEMGAVSAVVGGLVLGGKLYDQVWLDAQAAVVAAAGLNLLAMLTALPVWFATDVRRPETAPQAVAGFFRDVGRVLRDCEARGSLAGLASLRGLMTAMMGALVAATLHGDHTIDELLRIGMWVAAGVAAGSLLAGVQRHPPRALGLVPLGTTGLALGLAIAAAVGVPAEWLCVLLGMMGGLVNVPLAATYQASVPADARGNAMAVRNMVEYLLTAVMSVVMFGLAYSQAISAAGQLWLIVALTLAAAAVAWWVLYRQSLEALIEFALWPLYRIHGYGPGFEHFPRRGPVVVIVNHSAWFDPLWLGKVVPRDITPMMTSLFYDLPGLRWLMRYVVRAIRVQASSYRREAPELQQAIAALDQGACVVIFPEGSCRKHEDRPLRQFGQGVWHILSERPDTPVVVCWIEGGWGSYFSWKNGKPMTGKPLDFWRRIDVAASAPQTLKPEMLTDQRTTRAYLRQVCLDTRRYLGLAPFAADKVLDEEESPAAL